MIGLFDSGYGGLTILNEFIKKIPKYSYIYLGDNKRAPYGSRTKKEIFRYTLAGIEFLFSQGCSLVIIACNTSSANALRKIQQEILPNKYPKNKVLGIFIPTIEKITGVKWNGNKNRKSKKTLAIFATSATVKSKAYIRETHKRDNSIQIIQQSCPMLVSLIESGDLKNINNKIKNYTEKLQLKMKQLKISWPPDYLLLGCTHYALIKKNIQKFFPKNTKIYNQGKITAKSLIKYIKKHPEINLKINKRKQITFLTTGNPYKVSKIASKFFKEEILWKKVKTIDSMYTDLELDNKKMF